jgi:hypothetical protein
MPSPIFTVNQIISVCGYTLLQYLPLISHSKQEYYTMRAAANGETYQERTKGKDVRTSNIVAAKVSPVLISSK